MPLKALLDRNKAWAEAMRAEDPQLCRRQSSQQAPRHLWLGGPDSRVPANRITGLQPGKDRT